MVNNFSPKDPPQNFIYKKIKKSLNLSKTKKEIGQTARNTDFFCRVWSFLAILFVFGL
jgi:hypothetical protein